MFKKDSTGYALYEGDELGEGDKLITGKKYLHFELTADTVGVAPDKVKELTEQLEKLLQDFLDDNTEK